MRSPASLPARVAQFAQGQARRDARPQVGGGVPGALDARLGGCGSFRLSDTGTSGWAAQRPASARWAAIRSATKASGRSASAAASTAVSSQPVPGSGGKGSESARPARVSGRVGGDPVGAPFDLNPARLGMGGQPAGGEVFLEQLVDVEHFVPAQVFFQHAERFPGFQHVVAAVVREQVEGVLVVDADLGGFARLSAGLHLEGQMAQLGRTECLAGAVRGASSSSGAD